MTTIRAKWLFAALGLSATLLLAGGAQASLITYEIDVNTTSLSGEAGYLDFQFNAGNTPFDPASATITNFTTNGVVTGVSPLAPTTGDVTGSLAGTLVINNDGFPNEYTPGIIYGSFFDVFVTLDIPVVSGTALGDNIFTLDVQDSNFNSLLSNDVPAVEIDLNAITGDPTVSNNNLSGDVTVSQTPEPASLLLIASGLIALVVRRGRIRG